MAEMAPPGRGNVGFGAIVNWAGALMSLALIAGVGVWGYQLISRDMSGVPIVRALEGPMRVQPDNPGGLPAQHQGLSVNSIAEENGENTLVDQVVLAPNPVGIGADDPAGFGQTETIETTPEPPQAQPQTLAGTSPTEDELRALVQQIANQSEPLGVEGGLGRSLRPQLRPASLQTGPVTAIRPMAASNVRELNASDVPADTAVVQLGAFDSPQIARTEWQRIGQRFNGFLDDKSRVIEQAERAGRTFYRLRAIGFDDLSDARRFCTALIAEGADCIPVVTR
ncbi:SPOR domain-containing protein [Parasulfitobacter algicola]|uniref:SPOR domain-containing protein n=1 Tax=Parasulfitobacter algicola TaxID=2614809 RepID=A0ABX2IWA7_9RHOB|nr:SPOR domain-containing protein [Sulfitobacter algicola]NSX55162.1 SPOR domain-containing protein [Sulfitobacter algicola]